MRAGRAVRSLDTELPPEELAGGLCHGNPEVTLPDRFRNDAAIVVNDRVQGEGEIYIQPYRNASGGIMPKVMVAGKVDLFKLHKAEYAATKEPILIETKPAKYLTIEGHGEPGGALFQTLIGALYAVAYTIKMTKKFAGQDYKVCTLEGLWWGSGGKCLAEQSKSEWRWKLMIRVPEFIGAADLKAAQKAIEAKGKSEHAQHVKIETLREGRIVQALHVGPYDQVGETIDRITGRLESAGLKIKGVHHEIYMSDPRRVPPERLRTIVRYSVA